MVAGNVAGEQAASLTWRAKPAAGVGGGEVVGEYVDAGGGGGEGW